MRWLWMIILLIVMGCKPPQIESEKFFSFEALIAEQIGALAEEDSIQKRASIGDRNETVMMLADSVTTNRELSLFKHLDMINQPVYKDLYTTSEDKDTFSNLWVKTISAVGGTMPVREIKFYYQQKKWLRKVEAWTEETNALFSAHQYMVLVFDLIDEKSVLTDYQIKGTQKILMNDSAEYEVLGEIRRKGYYLQPADNAPSDDYFED